MASLLLPPSLDPCQSGLRERRRSSFNSAASLPAFLAGSAGLARSDDVFIDDQFPSKHTLQIQTSPSSTAIAPPHPQIAGPVASPESPSSISTSQVEEKTKPSLTSSQDAEATRTPTPQFERMKWRLAAGYFAYFMCGWGDGVTGTVLPYFVAEFRVTSMMSSLLYAGSTIGFIFGALVAESIIRRLGTFGVDDERCRWFPLLPKFFTKNGSERAFSPSQATSLAVIVAGILHAMFFVVMGTKAGFWALFGAYALAAFARCLLTTPLNQYFTTVKPASVSYAFAFWSFGGVGAPFVCQAVIAAGVPWHLFYFGSLLLSATNIILLTFTYRPTPNEFLHDKDVATVAFKLNRTASFSDSSVKDSVQESTKKESSSLVWALKLPYCWAVVIFSVLYCGSETATQSFMVTYLLKTRNANPNTVGYVTSGFWGGITIGRLAWGYLVDKLNYKQRQLFVEGCLLLAFIMELTIWFAKSYIANAVSTAIIGTLFGPLFPACLSVANDILPTEVQMISMALISAGGSLGAAIFPFIAGTISSNKGAYAIPYLNIPLSATIALMWIMFLVKKPLRGN